MMVVFSKRNKLTQERIVQLNEIDTKLFNRLWNVFFCRENAPDFSRAIGGIGNTEKLLDLFGCRFDYPEEQMYTDMNMDKLRGYLADAEWYETYDFVERYIAMQTSSTDQESLQKEFNTILEEENSGYRIVNGLVVPIINQGELESLQKSATTEFESVNRHFEKAIAYYSKREKPDYENSVKESISAVEAICCIITGLSGAQATLGAALKKLKDNGVHIHGAMERAFLQLYGYTSDENGIRHGGIDFQCVPAEDARYMLISCSAFVNYLIEKWRKSDNALLAQKR